MLKTKVILSEVTNLSEARYGAGMGVDFIGFSLDSTNENYVTHEEANTIRDWLSGVSIIGELGANDNSGGYKIDYLQVSDEKQVYNFDEPILILSLNDNNFNDVADSIERTNGLVSFFVLKVEIDKLNSLKDLIQELCASNKCFIATTVSPENINEILSMNPYGIVLYGTKERKPGLSTYDGLADVLEVLELD